MHAGRPAGGALTTIGLTQRNTESAGAAAGEFSTHLYSDRVVAVWFLWCVWIDGLSIARIEPVFTGRRPTKYRCSSATGVKYAVSLSRMLKSLSNEKAQR